MIRISSALAVAFVALTLGAPASGQMGPATTADTAKGKTLVTATGMTLYSFDRDSAGKSACNGGCSQNWPPLAATPADAASGDWTVITRDDGSKQWAYKAKPLYSFAKDTKPGDVTGDGLLNGAWHVAMP